ncbi:MAG: HAD family hydrolase [Desulfobacterales bacterium]|jgi:putative hydrolase of the HAD superfamily
MANEDLIRDYLSPMSPLPTSLTPGGSLVGKIQCIFFDIYGTLFISGSGDISVARKSSPLSQQLEHLTHKYDIAKTPQALVTELYEAIETKHRQLRDNGIDYPEIKIDEIWQQILAVEDIHRVRKFAIEYELIVNPVYPMPNLEALLQACRQQGLAMGIISNAQFFTSHLFEWFLNARMEQLGFDSELIFLSYQLGYAKPSKALFKMAASAIDAKGFNTTAALLVGNDMLNDIYPAHHFGFQTALFAGDARSLRLRKDESRCRDLSADLILTDLGQLIDHIT